MFNTALFSAMLASAGIPLYIHLPRYAVAELGLSLTAVGTILLFIRLIDFVQDPLLGHLVDRWSAHRRALAIMAVFGIALGLSMVFSIRPSVNLIIWLIVSLIVVFTSYSLASVLFYSQGILIASNQGSRPHFRLAGYRETGTLFGIVLAALAPTLLVILGREASVYRDYGLILSLVAVGVGVQTLKLWSVAPVRSKRPVSLSHVLTRPVARLLVLATINAFPVAITASLFLFYVEDHLQLVEYSGAFLLLFFVAAGLSAPVCSRLAGRFGAKRVLVPAMVLSIAGFAFAAVIPPGSTFAFALICLATGTALGADMVILPALFAVTLARQNLPIGLGFGLWSFAAKFSLAIAAAALLPVLDLANFTPNSPNDTAALTVLVALYAILPCFLKALSIAMVFKLPTEVTSQ